MPRGAYPNGPDPNVDPHPNPSPIAMGEGLSAAEKGGSKVIPLLQLAQGEGPTIPALPVIGMRNRVIHGYGRVDNEIVWDAAQNCVPSLAARLTDVLAEEASCDAPSNPPLRA